jgi:uroporphyrinogen-III synthase
MRVLITRPRADAERLAAEIHALGHTTFVEPLIEIAIREGPALPLENVQALVFTSANGARAAARRTPERALPVVAVGPATAEEARALGFTNVSESGGEGVDGLARHIRDTLTPNAGALLHLTGTATAGDLSGALAAAGFAVRTEQVYDAHPAETLSGALSAGLTGGLIDAAMFYSPRTASLFAALVDAADLAASCRHLTAVALSPAVAQALRGVPFRKVLVAAHATTPAMLAALGSL